MNAFKTVDILDSIVPISRFNKGGASKIFSEVKKTGSKIVVKNNVPECVLLSPEEYKKIIEDYEDALLLAESERRLADPKNQKLVPFEDVMKENGITQKDLDEVPDEDIELE